MSGASRSMEAPQHGWLGAAGVGMGGGGRRKVHRRVRLAALARVASIAVGIQFGWALQLSLLTPYVQDLGIAHTWASYIWLCGPISGMIVQPLVGHWSDRCTLRWGRRRPFVVLGAVMAALAVMVIGFSSDIGHAMGDPLPKDAVGPRWKAVIIFILGFWLLDLANNTIQGPCRALLADFTGREGKRTRRANAYFSAFMALGNIMGFAAGANPRLHHLPLLAPLRHFIRTPACDAACANLKSAFLLHVALLMAFTCLSVTAARERSLEEIKEAEAAEAARREGEASLPIPAYEGLEQSERYGVVPAAAAAAAKQAEDPTVALLKSTLSEGYLGGSSQQDGGGVPGVGGGAQCGSGSGGDSGGEAFMNFGSFGLPLSEVPDELQRPVLSNRGGSSISSVTSIATTSSSSAVGVGRGAGNGHARVADVTANVVAARPSSSSSSPPAAVAVANVSAPVGPETPLLASGHVRRPQGVGRQRAAGAPSWWQATLSSLSDNSLDDDEEGGDEEEGGEEEEEEEEEEGPTRKIPLWEMMGWLRQLPGPLTLVMLVSALTWIAWFPFLLFDTDWMGREIFGGSPDGPAPAVARYYEGVHWGAFGLVLNSVVQGLASLAIDPAARRFGAPAVWGAANVVLSGCLMGTVALNWLMLRAPAAAAAAAPVAAAPPPVAPSLPPKPASWVLQTALALFAALGIPLAVTYSIPYSLAATFTSTEGGGQGVAMGVLNLAVVLPQMAVSVGVGPFDKLFGGGNLPAFAAAAFFAAVGAAAACVWLPKPPPDSSPFFFSQLRRTRSCPIL